MKKTYDVNKLYKTKWLTIDEVAFLLGGISRGNVYVKLMRGMIPSTQKINKRNMEATRVDSEDVYKYVLKQRAELAFRIARLQIPTEEIDWEARE